MSPIVLAEFRQILEAIVLFGVIAPLITLLVGSDGQADVTPFTLRGMFEPVKKPEAWCD